MSIENTHHIIELIARLIELAGAGVILVAVPGASYLFVRDGFGEHGWRHAYSRYRSNLGRGILLGLELLVAADIISTITAPLSISSVALLGAVVLIRTFLSFSLETEIEGMFPWQRAQVKQQEEAKPR